jgi:S1-C subfamily serine protease
MNELNTIKNKHNIGDTITLTIMRDGAEKTVDITLLEQP